MISNLRKPVLMPAKYSSLPPSTPHEGTVPVAPTFGYHVTLRSSVSYPRSTDAPSMNSQAN